MGWCSGTDVFDKALDLFLEFVPEEERPGRIKQWLEHLEKDDWDCIDESDYFVEYIKPILKERDPDEYFERYGREEWERSSA